jgi:DNA-binding IclR family transcriptional regulator
MAEQGVAAVERALSILSALERDEEGELLTLATISRRTGLYKSTVLRLIVSLKLHGYVIQLENGTYQIGPTPFRLAAAFQRSNRLSDHVLPVLNKLVGLGTESPSFHIRYDNETRLCLFRVDSNHSTLDRVNAGALFPLDRGAPGTVILAFEGRRGERFEQARKTGTVVSFGERDPDCAAIASPVFAADGKLAGALSVSGPKHRFTPKDVKKMTKLVFDAASSVTRELGGRFDLASRAASISKAR